MSSSSLPKRSISKSLTPSRKHHKLLKDGSGGEVWPPEVEVIFANGLRDFLKRPESITNGRQKWRNGYLEQYLKEHNVTRLKKQIASHIQVLRNMWKGTPYFYLVANAEELWAECEHVRLSPSSPSPSPADTFFYKTHTRHAEMKAELSDAVPFHDPDDSDSSSCSSPIFSDRMSTHSSSPSSVGSQLHPSPPFTDQLRLPSSSLDARLPPSTNHYPPAGSPVPYGRPQYGAPSAQSFAEAHAGYFYDANRITKILLSTVDMTPFTVDLDALFPHTSTANQTVQLEVHLLMPSGDMTGCNLDLHGFTMDFFLGSVWAKAAWCVTTLVSPQGMLQTSVQLEVKDIVLGVPHVRPHNTELDGCRWLERDIYSIIQEFIVDDKKVLHITYTLDRRMVQLPSVALLGWRLEPQGHSAPGPQYPTPGNPYEDTEMYPIMPSSPPLFSPLR